MKSPASVARPRCLFVDDEEPFLRELLRQRDSAVAVETLHLDGGTLEDVLGMLRAKLDEARPDALLLDIRLEGTGLIATDLVKLLREPQSADGGARSNGYLSLPIVLMTQNSFGATPHEDEAVGDWVEAVLYDKGGKSNEDFLKLTAESLPQWQRLARERVWAELDRSLARALADRTKNHKATAEEALNFMGRHLNMKNAFVRLDDPDVEKGRLCLLAHYNGSWADKYLELDPLQDVPLLTEVLNSNAGGISRERISAQEAGVQAEDLTDRPMIGARLYYADAAIGAITVVGERGDTPFKDRDLNHLIVAANFLAAVCGRAIRQKEQQKAELDFANRVASCGSEAEVASALATFVHRTVHRDTPRDAKTTVRLLEPGTYALVRKALVGHSEGVVDKIITLNDRSSIYAQVVRNCKSENVADVKKHPIYTPTWNATRSELCVPLDFGGVALGAVNLEFVKEAFYDNTDDRHVAALANHAALIIRNLRARRFADALLDWATEAERLGPANIWEKIYRSLFEYCGYGVLLHCVPPAIARQDDKPWIVRHVHVPANFLGIERSADRWSTLLRDNWTSSYLRRCIGEFPWAPTYSIESQNFVSGKDLLGDQAQAADAVIPLAVNECMHGALLLLWFHVPPWSDDDKALYARFGQFGGELMRRETALEAQKREKAELEMEALWGNAFQLFHHLYNNAAGGIKNRIQTVESRAHALADGRGNVNDFMEAVAQLHLAVEGLPKLERAIDFMRLPKPERCSVAEAWHQIALELEDKRQRVKAELGHEFEDCTVWADPKVLELILYVLLDNALDALAGWHDERLVCIQAQCIENRVVISVSDNGPGVSKSVRPRLFAARSTTSKAEGLGRALYISARRAREMGGELRLAESDRGARFELELPSHITTGGAP